MQARDHPEGLLGLGEQRLAVVRRGGFVVQGKVGHDRFLMSVPDGCPEYLRGTVRVPAVVR
ncbi:hypothetical protein [Aurantimonas manganoxydans]|uniref:hypothetical protein n=1 Tax=Aurantimonas manganoxydans TaxID=651183 RepID=UPI0012B5E189|nr:hypothetical protein [Aurantimonas manganoxydans]